MNTETKLNRFCETVRKEAQESNTQKLKEIDEKYKKSVAEFEKSAVQKYSEMAEDAAIQAEKLKQKDIAAANAKVKKALMQKRGEYIQKVFDNVLARLNDFFKSEEYGRYLVDCVQSHKSLGEGITAQIMERDEALAKDSLEKCGVKVETTTEDFLGGVRIIIDENRISDCTMRSKFEAEKARFNKIKIL